MKQYILLLLIFVTGIADAQTPQFAVVRPDGTTYICTSWDSAYNKASDGDNVYVPGGVFSISNPINKRLQIIGAGSDEDSCLATGPTIINSFTLGSNASNGLIEGIKTNGAIVFDSPSTIANYTIIKCDIGLGIGFANSTTAELLTVKNCYIGSNFNTNPPFSIWGNGVINNSVFLNNRFIHGLSYTLQGGGHLFSNNNFFYYQQYYSIQLLNGSIYQNNIFQVTMNSLTNNSIFYNNINGYPTGSNNSIYNYVYEPADSTFINPGVVYSPGFCSYDKHNNYKLKSNSLGKNTGTDGTDRGNYGGISTWIEGSIPHNPHIYFRQVPTQTNANGQLPVQYKVRTNN